METGMYHSDEPQLEDRLNHAGHVEIVAGMIDKCAPPFVVGIHGDWGAGKTSFLKKLRLYLAGTDCSYDMADEIGKQLWPQNYRGKSQKFETIWFEAWRYQFEPNPIVALLQEVRSHFSFKKGLHAGVTRILDEAAKLTYAALASIDEVTKQIGIQSGKIVQAGEKWEKQTLAERLPSHICRILLEDAIKTLVGEGRRLVIFVDDLDRCQGPVAFRLLESMKIYLSIPSCIFVLGLDWQNIKRAVAAELVTTGLVDKQDRNEALIHAADYLSKLCQTVHPLPLLSDPKPYLEYLMDGEEFHEHGKGTLDRGWIDTLVKYDLLTRNPRKIKAFVNALALYLSQLTPLIPGMGPVDKELALIAACMRLNEDRVFRILESNASFWQELVSFCRLGQAKIHEVFTGRNLSDHPELPPADATGQEWQPTSYDPLFPDPADERVFRLAKLIREWRGGNAPTDVEFSRYIRLQS